jgi:hypothetical protein
MPNSQCHILLFHFTATVWKFAKTAPWTLVTKELAVASQQRTISHFLSHQGFFLPKTTLLSFPIHPTFLRSPDWR